MEARDGGPFDGAIHALDLALRPRMLGLGQPMDDVVESAGIPEGVGAEEFLTLDDLSDLGRAPGFALGIREVRAFIGEHGVDLVGHGLHHSVQEVSRDPRFGLLMEFGEGELGCAVNGNEQVEPELCCMKACSVSAPAKHLQPNLLFNRCGHSPGVRTLAFGSA
jgi:hypothetical protein